MRTNFLRWRAPVPTPEAHLRAAALVLHGSRNVTSSESIQLAQALDAASDVGDVRRAVRVAAGGVVQPALQQHFRAILGFPAVFADQRRDVEQRGGTRIDQFFQDLWRAPQALVALRVRDHGQQAAFAQIEQAVLDHGRKIDLIKLEQHRFSPGVGQAFTAQQPLKHHFVEVVLAAE